MLFAIIPLADAALQWQPRWAGTSAIWQVIGWVLCLFPLALVCLLYRAELRLVPLTVARTLLAVRLASTAAVLAVLALQPVVHMTTTETIRGRVVLAFDQSHSMSIADPQRPLIDKLRLVRALKLATDLCSEKQLDSWIADIAARGQVSFSLEGTGTDDRTRQTFDRVCQRIDQLSRAGLAAAVAGDSGGLLTTIESKHDVSLLGFSESAAVLPREALSQTLGSIGPMTDLGAPLDWTTASSGNPPVGLVLLTDGRHNGPASPVAKAAALGRLGVPVYPIVLGSRTPPTDVSIARVQAPASVFLGAEATVEAAVQVNALSGRTLTLELQHAGQPPIVERIQHPGGSRLHTVRVPVRLEEAGAHPITIRVRPEPEDTHPENDSRTVTIQAADDKAKVLLIDGEARWEYHYLASALSRDRSINVESVLFAQPRIGKTIDGDDAAALPARVLPSEPDALDRYDAIVLGDVSPEQLSAENRERLDRYVSERGGTLIVIAGKRAMPGAYFRPSLEHDPLRKLLPLESMKMIAPPNGFSVVPTPGGSLASFLQLDNTPETSAERWSELPRHYWGVVGRAKPGASVLATEREPVGADTGDPGAWEKEHALVAWHNVGFGRVLFVGIESTWRMRLRVGDALHHRLWGQVLRWAASDQALIVGNSTVRFGPRRAIVPQGEDVEIAARWLDAKNPLKPNTPAAVRVVRPVAGKPDEAVATVPLTRPESRPRELAAQLHGLPPGEYAVELAIPDRANDLTTSGPNGVMAPLRAWFRVTPRESAELSDLSCDIPLLEEIAAKSGGRVFVAEEAAELAPLLASRSVTRDVEHEWRLAESWPTLIVLLVLLGFEWAMRKWAGLP
jgi:hypothetical protein